MIIVFIICAILYLIMIYAVLYLYYAYRKDYNDLEYRILQLEKRVPSKIYKDIKDDKELQELIRQHKELMNTVFIFKDGDNMACKKGRGGRKK